MKKLLVLALLFGAATTASAATRITSSECPLPRGATQARYCTTTCTGSGYSQYCTTFCY